MYEVQREINADGARFRTILCEENRGNAAETQHDLFDKAFTVRIPDAVLILMGVKKWENRPSLPDPVKGRCGMSCSRGSNENEYLGFFSKWERFFEGRGLPALPSWEQVKDLRGMMIATMDYEACAFADLHTITASNDITDNNTANLIVSDELYFWQKGHQYWWKLSNIRRLDDPFYVKGNLGMWDFDLGSVRRKSEKAKVSLKESLAALTAAQKALMNGVFRGD
jgi:hypothetical protein